MSSPRIAPGTFRQLGPFNWVFSKGAARVIGVSDAHIFSTLGRAKGLFHGWLHYSSRMMPFGKLSRHSTELVIIRTAHLRTCEYELDHHKRLGRRAGIDEAEFSRILQGPEAGWTGLDEVLLRSVDELVGTKDLSDLAWKELAEHLDERELIEFVLLVGQYDSLATTIGTLRIERDFLSTALDRARGLLDPARLDGPVDDSRGYLDLLGPPETAASSTLWVMQNSVFAAVYERAWRPIFTRLYSLGGTSAAKFDRRLVTHLGRPGDRTILDVACGPGNYTRRLSERLTGDGVCIGLDFSVPMVARAVDDNSGERVAYVRGDAHRLPFPDGSIDTVCCLAALYLISDPQEVIDELARVVAPGGEVAIFTSLRTRLTSSRVVNRFAARSGYRLFGRDEVTDRLRAAGLVEVEQTITGQAQYVTARKP